MPLIIPANTLSGGYEVANSCRFDDGSDHYVEREWDSTGNRRTWTMSFWFKGISRVEKQFCGASANADGTVGSNVWPGIIIGTNSSTGGINIQQYTGSAYECHVETKALIADPTAWYHCVIRWDTTQSTDTDRLKIYLNGTLQELTTSGGNYTLPTQNLDGHWNVDTYHHRIGKGGNSNGDFDGYMAEWCFIDGSSLAPTSFGEFDEDSPTIWKPKDVSGLTFGTNGFYLDFEDSSALGNDVSGNNNDFGTVVNLAATDQSSDSPTNNFATLNSVYKANSQPTFSEGNLRQAPNTTTYQNAFSTIGVTSGKWYAEMKVNGSANSANYYGVVAETEYDYLASNGNVAGTTDKAFTIAMASGDKRTNGSNSSYGSAIADTNIFMIALDIDNAKVWFGNNGTWFDSGDPGAGSDEAFSSINTTYPYFFGGTAYTNGYTSVDWNFGSPSFAISSGNADANGYGNFEYSVPSGFYSLCTKNLAEFGG